MPMSRALRHLAVVLPLLCSCSVQAVTSGLEQAPVVVGSKAPEQKAAKLTTPSWLRGDSKLNPRDDALYSSRQPQNGRAFAASNPRAAGRQLPVRYIVQLKTEPAAAAMGPLARATTSEASANSTEKQTRRQARQARGQAAAAVVQASVEATAASAGVTSKVTRKYSYALSGFVVENPTAAELKALAADPNVVSITPDRIQKVRTYTTPKFLGLVGDAGPELRGRSPHNRPYNSRMVWDQLGGVMGYSGAGEGVIIGVLDTGIWMPEQTCFADNKYWAPPGSSSSQLQFYYGLQRYFTSSFKGTCAPEEGSNTKPCNNKVVGCRYYTEGFVGPETIKEAFPYEHISCRDAEGHGSHTSSTAAGNYGIAPPGVPSGSVVSGMAPRARIAMYKVCWGRDEWFAGCMTTDIVAAVEDAIKDDVDIISFSISGSASSFRDAQSTAFLNAARAGIFVSASAGNDGPGPTLEHLGPWLTTVAASTHNRRYEAKLTLGNGQFFVGAGTQAAPLGPLPFVYARDAAVNGTNEDDAALCYDNLDAAQIAGKIVACDRGVNIISKKVTNVKQAGGKGVVLLNVPEGRTNLVETAFDLPLVHLLVDSRDAVIAYARTTPATATLGAAVINLDITAPTMADFSSRGPIQIANAVVLKPDITAPGVNIYAAGSGDLLSPPYQTISGTSMSTPHISGIAALIKDKYPYWSPMAIKSAIMTTAYQTTKTGDVGKPFGTALDYGAGHVDPAAALNPGLVFDSSYVDWQRFLCDVEPDEKLPCTNLCTQQGTPAAVVRQPLLGPPGVPRLRDEPQPCIAANFNGPSISQQLIINSLTVQRKVTAVTRVDEGMVTFTATGSADPGNSFDVAVSPSSFSVRAGQLKSVSITISARDNTPVHQYSFGQVVWTSTKGHKIRIPIAVNFTDFSAPEIISPSNRMPAFTYNYKIQANATTTVDLSSTGLQVADILQAEIMKENSSPVNFSAPGLGKFEITVPEGNDYFALGTFSDDYPDGSDIDLYLVDVNGTIIGQSLYLSSTEAIEAKKGLPAGTYTAYVQGYRVPDGNVTAKLYKWMMSFSQPAQNGLMQFPASVPTNLADASCCPVTLAFSGLDFAATPKNRYMAVIQYTRRDGKPATIPRSYVHMVE